MEAPHVAKNYHEAVGFYQTYELEVDFVERVREEITPFFAEYIIDDTAQGGWGNGHVPFEECGPWTHKFIDLFKGNFLSNVRLSAFSPSNSYDWHIGIEKENKKWDQGGHNQEPEIYPYQVKATTLNVFCSPCRGDKTLFATDMDMPAYRGYYIGYGTKKKMLVIDELVVDRNPCLLNTHLWHKIDASGERNMASFVFTPYVSFAGAVAYAREIGILIERTTPIIPYYEEDWEDRYLQGKRFD